MSNGTTHLATAPPLVPGDADFAIYIDFKRGDGNPTRVFQAADAIIRALQRLDHTLCASIDSHIEPILVLEEIESGSLKIWLKDVLKAVDDDVLKKLDWKPAVGKYLVRAKYVYIKWANKSDKNVTLLDLAKEIQTVAAETDVKHLPDYSPPSITDLVGAAKEIDNAKNFLIPGSDRMSYQPAPSSGTAIVPAVEFNLLLNWAPHELLSIATKETIKFENMQMNLIVKRPDYLGTSMWDFRHGKAPISAKIADVDWLQRFQARAVDVRPGDALKCRVAIERKYGHDNELIEESYTITKVEGVLQKEVEQSSFFSQS